MCKTSVGRQKMDGIFPGNYIAHQLNFLFSLSSGTFCSYHGYNVQFRLLLIFAQMTNKVIDVVTSVGTTSLETKESE